MEEERKKKKRKTPQNYKSPTQRQRFITIIRNVTEKKKKLKSLIRFHSVNKAMAPHSSTLAWKIPWTEELGRLESIGSRRVGHD